jgi:hypothetical protein
MGPSTPDRSRHPGSEVLFRFALGLLDRETTVRVGRHLLDCDACYGIVVTAPDDRLLLLLRQLPFHSVVS